MPQTTSSSSPFEDDAPEPDAPAAPAAQASTDALDSLLDEIDDTIQTNASQFVRSFVQKGGQ
ncbi:ubiquitin-like protein Pup [Demequina sp. TTPB684]|jgi:ubiquitin-like protein Pup|uniref:ubiquitin-like protein Pup n=1 Tax=unclassified Demequina TaxID=2620311 RepID=UPI001CF4D406|nr:MULTISPECIES: ubiquitin-like protein Pup [unclassified Demequina]MCB2413925.1 ubiquitin-like protein Pup [Demequina sp. TTPB684]UPU89387.1 ubiquitin-like protein Pup [Demequina sp. TMPB413]